MASQSQRLAITEYGAPLALSSVAATLGTTSESLRRLLSRAARRIAAALKVYHAVVFGDGVFQVNDVAGILRVSPRLDLEVKPKFLAGNEPNWREDFFFIATITKYGRILPRDSLASRNAPRGDLADLLARAMTQMYDDNRRRPLRVYRRRTWESFYLDGEVDFESLVLPEEDGVSQHGLLLDRQNPFNRVIHQGMSSLLGEVRDGDTRRKLAHTILKNSPQNDRKPVGTKGLPARHRRWQDLYDLSLRVLSAFGLSYADLGHGPLPGFLVRTAETWESLLLTGLRVGLPDRAVTKRTHPIGIRLQPGVKPSEVSVEPDITIEKAGNCTLVVDAKYKASKEHRPRQSISRPDVYEAAAFLRACGCKRALLLYPSSIPAGPPGTTTTFERITIGAFEIIGMTVDVHGISRQGEFGAFCRRLADSVRSHE